MQASSSLRRTLIGFITFGFVVIAALGFGQYVYPHNPALVWGLLFFLWACYRLRMLAVARFGPKSRAEGTPIVEGGN